jgi:hypothetical protein
MNDHGNSWTGGCLCGDVRYEAEGEPQYSGFCCCADCRKASGSGFMPFLGFPGGSVRFTGRRSQTFTSKAASGRDAVRNFCPLAAVSSMGKRSGKLINSGSTPAPWMIPRCFIPRLRYSCAIVPRGRPFQPVSKPSRQCHRNDEDRDFAFGTTYETCSCSPLIS